MSRRWAPLAGWALALAAAAAFCALGSWQLGRRAQKQATLDAAAAVLAARTPHDLAAAAADPARAQGYDWAAGEGGFLDAPAILLDNQQRDGRPGVRAYRLFMPASVAARAGAAPVLVELGWLPLPPDRTLPAVPRPDGPLRLSGLLVPPPAAGLGTPMVVAQPDGTLLATALAGDALPARAPRVLKPDPALPIGYARDLDVLPNTMPPERHLGYAVQWFGLAIAVLAIALVLTLRRKPRR